MDGEDMVEGFVEQIGL